VTQFAAGVPNIGIAEQAAQAEFPNKPATKAAPVNRSFEDGSVKFFMKNLFCLLYFSLQPFCN
jgi:hypothetical protein